MSWPARCREISRDLETSQGERTELLASDRQKLTKAETLFQAGIPPRTANDYEQLTGGREEQAQQIATAAAESYFATDQPLSMGGLKSAVRQALVSTFSEPVVSGLAKSAGTQKRTNEHAPICTQTITRRQKTETLEQAGINERTAERYEELADPQLRSSSGANIQRRHLSQGQRAILVAKVVESTSSQSQSELAAKEAGLSRPHVVQASIVLRYAQTLLTK